MRKRCLLKIDIVAVVLATHITMMVMRVCELSVCTHAQGHYLQRDKFYTATPRCGNIHSKDDNTANKYAIIGIIPL